MKEQLIPVPLHLCKMLLSEPEDLKDPEKFPDFIGVAKGLLRVLVEAHMPQVAPVKTRRTRKRGLPQEQTGQALKDPSGN